MRGIFLFLSLSLIYVSKAQDGVPDASFGTNGRVFHSMPATGASIDVPNNQRIVVLSNQQILHCFTYYNGSETDFGLARYNSNGLLDATFDGDGILTTNIGTNDRALSMIVQADGKIIVAGTTGAIGAQNFAVVRYNANGTLDNTFDGEGIAITNITGTNDDVAYFVNLQTDGKIIAAGSSFSGSVSVFAVVRYNTNGTLDASFDSDGIVTTSIAAGGIDQIFGTVMQVDNKIIAVGSSFNGTVKRFALVRYNTNGSPDAGFDTDGIVTTTFGSNDAEAYAVTLDVNKIVAAGYSYNGSNNDFTVVRYNSNGSLDNSFSGDGIVTSDLTADQEQIAYSVAMQGDGKIVVAGVGNNGNDNDFAVTRYETNGTMDLAFGGIGYSLIDFTGGDDYGYSIGSQGTRLIIGGATGVSLALVRLINSSPILPVSVTAFTATKGSNTVELQWKTAVEQNIETYIVERSSDGSRFSALGSVAAQNINASNTYSFIDSKPLAATAFYRLKIVQKNGDVMYSRVVAVRNQQATTRLEAFPNPVKNTLNVQVSRIQEDGYLNLLDVSGRVIQSIGVKATNNTMSISVDMSALKQGIYFIRLNDEILKVVKN